MLAEPDAGGGAVGGIGEQQRGGLCGKEEGIQQGGEPFRAFFPRGEIVFGGRLAVVGEASERGLAGEIGFRALPKLGGDEGDAFVTGTDEGVHARVYSFGDEPCEAAMMLA